MIQKMFGVEMEVPSGKLPGFYAQVIHKIGDGVNVFDRDQRLFVIETEDDRNKLVEILDKYKMTGERFTLWLLPPDASSDLTCDYGFVSATERAYLYDHLVSFFRIKELSEDSKGAEHDCWAALEQMKEHIILSLPEQSNGMLHIIDKNNTQLIEGIASAYHITVEWL